MSESREAPGAGGPRGGGTAGRDDRAGHLVGARGCGRWRSSRPSPCRRSTRASATGGPGPASPASPSARSASGTSAAAAATPPPRTSPPVAPDPSPPDPTLPRKTAVASPETAATCPVLRDATAVVVVRRRGGRALTGPARRTAARVCQVRPRDPHHLVAQLPQPVLAALLSDQRVPASAPCVLHRPVELDDDPACDEEVDPARRRRPSPVPEHDLGLRRAAPSPGAPAVSGSRPATRTAGSTADSKCPTQPSLPAQCRAQPVTASRRSAIGARRPRMQRGVARDDPCLDAGGRRS